MCPPKLTMTQFQVHLQQQQKGTNLLDPLTEPPSASAKNTVDDQTINHSLPAGTIENHVYSPQAKQAMDMKIMHSNTSKVPPGAKR